MAHAQASIQGNGGGGPLHPPGTGAGTPSKIAGLSTGISNKIPGALCQNPYPKLQHVTASRWGWGGPWRDPLGGQGSRAIHKGLCMPVGSAIGLLPGAIHVLRDLPSLRPNCKTQLPTEVVCLSLCEKKYTTCHCFFTFILQLARTIHEEQRGSFDFSKQMG